MRAELRGFYSIDDGDLAEYRPDDGECFQVAITAFIGPAGEASDGEMFDFTVCTASWLVRNPPPKNFEFLRATILMGHWDYDTLDRSLRDLCRHTEGRDWNEVATKLSRFGYWEFENDGE